MRWLRRGTWHTRALLTFYAMFGRYSSGRFLELLNYALNPGNEVLTEELFNAGFESGAYVVFWEGLGTAGHMAER